MKDILETLQALQNTPVPPTDTSTPKPPTNTPTATATATRTPMLIPTTTNTPTHMPTFSPTPTPTDATSQSFDIISPRDETQIGCGPDGPCLVTVQVQWVPPTPTDKQRLYILVQPRPGQGFPYYVQPFPTHSGNGIWIARDVGIGFNDPSGTHFWVCALVSAANLPDGAQLTELPSDPLICNNIYR